ncbi:MAG: flippase [Thermodesulfobacteriota bacterium]
MHNFLKKKIHNLASDKKFSEILTGSVWALGSKVLATALTLAISVVVARFYGAQAMGILAVVQSFLMLTTIFTVLGTNTSILRMVPEHMEKYSVTSAFRVYRKTQYLVVGVSLVTGTLLFFFSGFVADKIFSKPHLTYFLSLAAMFVVFNSLMDLNTQAVRGLRLIRVFAFMQLLPSAITLFILVIITYYFHAQENPVYAYLAAIAITALIGALVMNKAFKVRTQPDALVLDIPVTSILSISFPMLMTASMQFLIGQTGVLMLAIFRSEAEVGYYAMAVKLATLTTFALGAVNSMAGPKFSELFHTGRMDELFYVAKKSSKLLFWTTTPVLLGLLLLGKPILGYFFGAEFMAAYPALVFLIMGQFVNSVSGSTAMFMNMTGRQNIFRNITFGAAALNISSNLLFIPYLGIIGAAISAMLSVSFWNIVTLIYMKKKHGRTTGYMPGFLLGLIIQKKNK